MEFVDRHVLAVPAPAPRVWDAVATTLAAADGPVARAAAALLRCTPRRTSGPPVPSPGAETPGFRVAEAHPPRRLRLEGGDALARYVVQFDVDAAAGTVSVSTWAAFAGGPLGRAYRAAVIGTGGHAVTMKLVLRRIRRRAVALSEARA